MEVDRQGRERGVTGKVAGKAAIRGRLLGLSAQSEARCGVTGTPEYGAFRL